MPCGQINTSVRLRPETTVWIWTRYGLQPHRLRHHMVSDDPNFETKVADIIGLYLHPPAHAAIFCVDEKSAVHALDRLDPILPFSPGRRGTTSSWSIQPVWGDLMLLWEPGR
jgi:hypothetical protein